MKRIVVLVLIVAVSMLAACKKDKESERFRFLTGTNWQSDILTVDGEDASQEGQPLHAFVGEAQFRKDGTGYFGQYTGTWYFSNQEASITIVTEGLPLPLTALIDELTASSLKIRTTFPVLGDPQNPNEIVITFIAKQ